MRSRDPRCADPGRNGTPRRLALQVVVTVVGPGCSKPEKKGKVSQYLHPARRGRHHDSILSETPGQLYRPVPAHSRPYNLVVGAPVTTIDDPWGIPVAWLRPGTVTVTKIATVTPVENATAVPVPVATTTWSIIYIRSSTAPRNLLLLKNSYSNIEIECPSSMEAIHLGCTGGSSWMF